MSFETPEYTANVDALGTLKFLKLSEALVKVKKLKFTKLRHQNYNGTVTESQNEMTTFSPQKSIWSCKIILILDDKITEMPITYICNGILLIMNQKKEAKHL